MKNPIMQDNGHFDCGSATDGTDQTECFTLRDWFAGQALVALADSYTSDMAAEAAYEYADAMLKVRGCHEA